MALNQCYYSLIPFYSISSKSELSSNCFKGRLSNCKFSFFLCTTRLHKCEYSYF
jgi:hypothetical protein